MRARSYRAVVAGPQQWVLSWTGRGIIERMPSPAAELSSMATALDELLRRVTHIADSYAAAERDDMAAELYQAERALTSAHRALSRVISAET
jgi:hypothetical protein